LMLEFKEALVANVDEQLTIVAQSLLYTTGDTSVHEHNAVITRFEPKCMLYVMRAYFHLTLDC
jgi:hypothetical protein